MSFNFLEDKKLVHDQIQEAGSVVVVEKSSVSLKAVVNRSADDMGKEFADEIGQYSGSGGALAMLSFSYTANGAIKAGDYLLYEGLRATIHKIKPRRYGGITVRLRCLVEETAA